MNMPNSEDPSDHMEGYHLEQQERATITCELCNAVEFEDQSTFTNDGYLCPKCTEKCRSEHAELRQAATGERQPGKTSVQILEAEIDRQIKQWAETFGLYRVEKKRADAAEAERDSALALVERLKEALESAQWVQHSNEVQSWSECSQCGADHNDGHRPGCEIASALVAAKSLSPTTTEKPNQQ